MNIHTVWKLFILWPIAFHASMIAQYSILCTIFMKLLANKMTLWFIVQINSSISFHFVPNWHEVIYLMVSSNFNYGKNSILISHRLITRHVMVFFLQFLVFCLSVVGGRVWQILFSDWIWRPNIIWFSEIAKKQIPNIICNWE